MKRIDLLVIGAGPAGLSAALTAQSLGLSVAVVDENPQPGGQIYRGLADACPAGRADAPDAEARAGRALLERFAASGIDCLRQTRVWQVDEDRVAYFSSLAVPPPTLPPEPLRASAIVLATGAFERPFPLPGWTTPGTMTVGAAQILLKTAGLLPPDDSVLIGRGPLLYQFAAQVHRAGGRLQAVIDAGAPLAPLSVLRAALPALRAPALLWRGARLLADMRRHGLRTITGAHGIGIIGDGETRGVRFVHNGQVRELKTGRVLLHAGLLPETHLAAALGCALVWHRRQQAWLPDCSVWQESSRPGIFIAGDGAGIGGAEAAQLSGQIAALEIARQAGKLSHAERDAAARPVFAARRRALAPRTLIETLYPPPTIGRTLPDATVVCRCESVTAGAIRQAVARGADSPAHVKILTRAGMGDCQGRLCACVTAALVAEGSGRDPATLTPPRVRFPVKPVTLEEIARSHSAAPPP